MNIARKPPIDPPPPEDDAARNLRLLLEMFVSKQAEVDAKQAELDAAERDKTGMQRIIDESRYWRRTRVELYVTLRAAADELYDPRKFPSGARQRKNNKERVRKWCELKKIVCKKYGKRWMVEANSFFAHVATEGLYPRRRPPAKSKAK
jgi:hypothetical protein